MPEPLKARLWLREKLDHAVAAALGTLADSPYQGAVFYVPSSKVAATEAASSGKGVQAWSGLGPGRLIQGCLHSPALTLQPIHRTSFN